MNSPQTNGSLDAKNILNSEKVILHLCASEFGSDTRDYREAGYDVRLITEDLDVKSAVFDEEFLTFGGGKMKITLDKVYGIIANPPCTMFSKARTRAKTPRDMLQGLELVEACLKIIWKIQSRIKRDANPEMPLKFWALENPDGYLKWFLGKPAFQYSPFEFGADYSKTTNLWGIFNTPIKPFWNGTNIKRTPSDFINPMNERDPKRRTDLRSIAPPEFTKAFFLANQ